MKRLLFPCIVLVLLAVLVILPVSAAFSGQNGTITLELIGENQINPGDNVMLKGFSNVSPNLVISVLGPGLPAAGVSPANLSAAPGTGVPVSVRDDNSWVFTWNTSWVKDTLPYTGKYTIRAWDAEYPDVHKDLFIYITKVYMTLTVTPSTITTDDYVTISGFTKGGTKTVDINIVPYGDTSGANILKTWEAPVDDKNNYFLQAHVNLPAGTYTLTATNPADKVSVSQTLTVAQGGVVTAAATPVATGTVAAATPVPTAAHAGSLVSLPGVDLSSDWTLPVIGAIVVVLVIIGIILFLRRGPRRPRGPRSRDL